MSDAKGLAKRLRELRTAIGVGGKIADYLTLSELDTILAALEDAERLVARNAPEVLCAQCGNPSMNAAPICYGCANKASPAAEQGQVVVPVELLRQLRHYTESHRMCFPDCGAPTEKEVDDLLAAAQEGKQLPPKLSADQFSLLLQLAMVSDPWPLNTGQQTLENLLDEEARARGFSDWIDAYHRFDAAQEGKP